MTGQSVTRWQTHKLVSGNLILILIAGEDAGLDVKFMERITSKI